MTISTASAARILLGTFVEAVAGKLRRVGHLIAGKAGENEAEARHRTFIEMLRKAMKSTMTAKERKRVFGPDQVLVVEGCSNCGVRGECANCGARGVELRSHAAIKGGLFCEVCLGGVVAAVVRETMDPLLHDLAKEGVISPGVELSERAQQMRAEGEAPVVLPKREERPVVVTKRVR